MTLPPLALTLAGLSIMIMAGRLGSLVERLGLPSALGELMVGVVLGVLATLVPALEGVRADAAITFVAELGVIILLFQIGLESSLDDLRSVGLRAAAIAVIGVTVPFALGTWWVAPWCLPGMGPVGALFVGASLTATSVGISGRVLRDRGLLQREAARLILGAAVIDDVLGLVILASISGIARTGVIDPWALGQVAGAAVAFLAGSLIIGQVLLRPASQALARRDASPATRLCVALATGLVLAATAESTGLAALVGAFAAGLVLDQAALPHGPRGSETDRRSAPDLEELLKPLGYFAIPVFFVRTGMAVDLRAFGDPAVLLATLILTGAAVAGKLAAGLPAPRGERWMVGWGMVPRGEVGLIFAGAGQALGVVPAAAFAAIVGMVMLTTLLGPLALARLHAGGAPPSG